jgi:hypothetical protein
LSLLIIKPPTDSVVLDMTTAPADGQVLTYDSASARWVPGDAWISAVLSSNVTSTSVTAANIAGFTFTPAANKSYLFEAKILAQTVITTTGIRIGYAAMTGDITCAARLMVPSSSTGMIFANMTGKTAQLGVVGTGIVTAQFVTIEGVLVAGAAPTSAFHVTLASEVAASTVTVLAGSSFRYREA